MICAIHQPNFFPWMGYFNKIARADVFVFLNQVDYEKSGHSMQCYTNRVGIMEKGKASWIHCPVIREHGSQRICNVRINNKNDWKSELKRRIKTSYKNADYYQEVSSYIFDLIDIEADCISDYNITVIESLVKKLDLATKIVKQSDLNTVMHSTSLLIEITKAVKCDSYIYGGGGSKYQDESLFQENMIKLISQNYKMPLYQQMTDEFVTGLSIIDTLFCCGFEQTKKLIKCNEESMNI